MTDFAHDPGIVIVMHPLAQHKLTLMRDVRTSTGEFRTLARELSVLLGYEAMRDLPLEDVEIETPLERMQAPRLAGKKLCLVSILRAGNGILDGMLDLVPSARIGHIGLFRDPDTLEPVEYYLKLPDDIGRRVCIVVDPMLATGHSAAAAIARLKQAGADTIVFVCLLAAPQGIACLRAAHPDVRIVTCAIDRELDDHGYIRPGLGDAGDRLFGTK
ncbi:uracil phosphoribosyltransferase [Novacetimonas hansenii]|uniref:uracil phosphoribosyltransferase n=1 Tax=Novacetimonas hansenii TaxID=436 RepID=UPI000789B594|nr:uracil phosphoribosyltransferase [Novacetimonas hansenii]RFO99532.1 uracil phosphoribosyltransferase [Novacetimonas hansenii]WEQ58956.1 uracil phosphoribosyltransferase [Novacetimonas hansenii]CUW47546.1 Uracil phosphoribosyltransferase [Novacetimonas hansenii]